MASTYSPNLALELITTGEQSGTWGATTNVNLGTLIEQAIVGQGAVVFASDANKTITMPNGTTSETRCAYLVLTSGVTLTAQRDLIVPTINKNYLVYNNTTGGQSIRVKTTAGTGIVVPNGKRMLLQVDATNVVEQINYITAISAATAYTSALNTVAGTNTITASATTTLSGYAVGQVVWGIAAATNTGAVTLDIGGLGAGAVQWQGAALKGGEFVIGMPFMLMVSAATPVFQMISPLYVIRQNSQSAAYTTVFSDMNSQIFHPTADNNPRTFTIDSNANVAYPIGTAITFINEINILTIAITSDVLVLAGTGATGSRTLGAMSMATAIKKTSTSWIISGVGIT